MKIVLGLIVFLLILILFLPIYKQENSIESSRITSSLHIQESNSIKMKTGQSKQVKRINIHGHNNHENNSEPCSCGNDHLQNEPLLQLLADNGVYEEPINVNELTLQNVTNEQLKLISELNLKSLTISGRTFDDLSPLENMRSLRKLIIKEASLKNLHALKDIRLETLDLSGSECKDYSDLVYMFTVVNLNLSGTDIEDIKILEKMPLLSRLNISNTLINKNHSTELLNHLEIYE